MSKFVFHVQNLVFYTQKVVPLPPKCDTSSFGAYCLLATFLSTPTSTPTYYLPPSSSDAYLLPAVTPTSYLQRCLSPTCSDGYLLPAPMPVYTAKKQQIKAQTDAQIYTRFHQIRSKLIPKFTPKR
ncbi:hypothetical protein P167DRAFT_550055 [Morchella conica CCBAS932]|uniref:Uncharacterized protein n=1 Tax=Morchella conica CCBAS932 TaxID=1392247 RepID=A0A3N4KCJ5_9PEZI|nr:hypothetical protein P167DRAFT_550055 [Morchella conica CCBAS932]